MKIAYDKLYNLSVWVWLNSNHILIAIMYDVVIAGGSVAGLLAAREIAKDGHTALVLEDGFEIGTPEHCGGLVSKKALTELGV